MWRLYSIWLFRIYLISFLVITGYSRNTTLTINKSRWLISTSFTMNSKTCNFPKTNVTRCFWSRRSSNKNLRRFCIWISSSKTCYIDISNFTVEYGCNSSCSCTTYRFVCNILSIINDINRRSISISFTTS